MNLPRTIDDFMRLEWEQIAPYYDELTERSLTAQNLPQWMADWSRLTEMVDETEARLMVSTTQNTADKAIEQRYMHFIENTYSNARAAEQRLKRKLIDSGLEPEGFEIPLRNMRASAELFRDENLPLLAEERKLSLEFDQIMGAQTVQWDGKEITLTQLSPVLTENDRARREQAWHVMMDRWQQDRPAINVLWAKFLGVRQQIAKNADFNDYRAYRWVDLMRFDYSPDNCKQFADAIEEVVVPAATHLYARLRQRLGVDTLRPWDVEVDPHNRSPLHPFSDTVDLEAKSEAIFRQVDPVLGDYVATMRREELLDLANRKNKGGGGYCTTFAYSRQPFIFMNAVGLHRDVQTFLHEAGHAFHVYETNGLPYHRQRDYTSEIAEVASMSMELLAGPYLAAERGGFYSEQEAARARIEHLEGTIQFWPYMAVVDLFQHWVYENPDTAADSASCDAQWAALWTRFMPGIDYTGYEDIMAFGWHRKMHIHEVPFYYVDYGLAQLGAVQVWRNSLTDTARAVAQYRHALSLGATRPLPELFSAAGAKFAFDAGTLRQAVDVLESTINDLERV